MKIAWIGLGKLGLPCATVISKKFNVVGYDINNEIEAPFKLADTIEDTIYGADFIFVSVPTPHHPKYGGTIPVAKLPPRDFDYALLKNVLLNIAAYKMPQQQIVLVSTVLPGTIRRELCKISPDIIYNPYLIALGSVAEDFLNPDLLIIGHENNARVESLISFYQNFYDHTVPHCVGTWEEAELVKILYNVYSTTKVTFSNTVNDIAKNVGNSDTNKILDALFVKSKKLTASDYMTKSGVGISGPCHPRDVIAMSYLSENLGLRYNIFQNIIQTREEQAKDLATFLESFAIPVCIVGLGYKKNLSHIDGSYSLLVSFYLHKNTGNIFIHDPLNESEFEADQPTVYYISQHHDFVKDMSFFPGSIIVDPWRMGLDIPNCTVINY